MPRLREMTEADVADFAPLFREIVAAGETYAYPEGLSDAQIATLWLERPPARTIVAEDEEGALLGSAKMGPNRPGRGAHIGTASFMVAAAARLWQDHGFAIVGTVPAAFESASRGRVGLHVMFLDLT